MEDKSFNTPRAKIPETNYEKRAAKEKLTQRELKRGRIRRAIEDRRDAALLDNDPLFPS